VDRLSREDAEISGVTRSKKEARASYNRLSQWYDILAGHYEKKYRDTALQELGVEEGEVVLEIGFGTGHCILILAQSVGNPGMVYGIDLSDGMVDITRVKVREAGLSNRAMLMLGDAAKLPFESNCFDAVFTSFTLKLFDTPEIPIVLEECRRVLRSDGRFGVVAMSKKSGDSLMMRLYEWLHNNFPSYVDCRPIFVEEALEDAGFEIFNARDVSMWGLSGEIVIANKR
jgi:ubiquinone/menaquinone biosynthesis C-methylase UbiE